MCRLAIILSLGIGCAAQVQTVDEDKGAYEKDFLSGFWLAEHEGSVDGETKVDAICSMEVSDFQDVDGDSKWTVTLSCDRTTESGLERFQEELTAVWDRPYVAILESNVNLFDSTGDNVGGGDVSYSAYGIAGDINNDWESVQRLWGFRFTEQAQSWLQELGSLRFYQSEGRGTSLFQSQQNVEGTYRAMAGSDQSGLGQACTQGAAVSAEIGKATLNTWNLTLRCDGTNVGTIPVWARSIEHLTSVSAEIELEGKAIIEDAAGQSRYVFIQVNFEWLKFGQQVRRTIKLKDLSNGGEALELRGRVSRPS